MADNGIITRSLVLEPGPEGWSVYFKNGGEALFDIGLTYGGNPRAHAIICIEKGHPEANLQTEALEALLHMLFFDRGLKALEFMPGKTHSLFEKQLRSLGFEESAPGRFAVSREGYFPCSPLAGHVGFDGASNGGITLRDRGVHGAAADFTCSPRYYLSVLYLGEEVGYITFRPGIDTDIAIEGNLGYFINEENRGKGFAGRAVELLVPIAELHGMKRLIISNHDTNIASIRVCEKLGARLVRAAPVPETHALWAQGKRRQNIFVLDIKMPMH